jgi:hypothetical protein
MSIGLSDWHRIGSIIKSLKPHECGNYFTNTSYGAV